ncbi:MAG: MATE family efflux transporter [Lachnospiraceae bacterium]|nr:MATE family efflux transporter [Lachnospiraceae bacterium]
MNEPEPKFEAKPFYKNVVKVALPIALQGVLTQVVEASDSLMLGVLSQDALSAISLATQVHFVLNMIFISINVVISTMAAQYFGKRDIVSVEKIFGFALKLSMITSFIFAAASFFIPHVLMTFFTNDPNLQELGVSYLRIAAFSYLMLGISHPCLSIFRNTSRVTTSSVFSSVAVVLNLIFNALLIYGLLGFPGLGIRGAALATVISRSVEAILCLIVAFGSKVIRFRFRFFFRDDRLIRTQFLKLLPGILGNMAVWGVGQTVFSAIIGHLGSDLIAANSLASIIRRLAACFSAGIGNGSAVIVGHALGKDHLDLAKLYSKKLMILSVSVAAVSSAILFLLIGPIVRISAVSLSPASQENLRWMLYFCCIYIFSKAVNGVFVHGCFYAGGDMKFGLICDAINLWGFIIPVGLLLAFVFHVPGLIVYCFLNMDEIVKIPAEIIHYRKYGWVRNITIKQHVSAEGEE